MPRENGRLEGYEADMFVTAMGFGVKGVLLTRSARRLQVYAVTLGLGITIDAVANAYLFDMELTALLPTKSLRSGGAFVTAVRNAIFDEMAIAEDDGDYELYKKLRDAQADIHDPTSWGAYYKILTQDIACNLQKGPDEHLAATLPDAMRRYVASLGGKVHSNRLGSFCGACECMGWAWVSLKTLECWLIEDTGNLRLHITPIILEMAGSERKMIAVWVDGKRTTRSLWKVPGLELDPPKRSSFTT